MDAIIIFFAKYAVFLIVLVAGVYWLTLPKRQKVQMLVFGLILGLVAFVLTRIGSSLYYDSRPFVDMNVQPIIPHADNNGFPSDHTALAFAAAATTFYMNKKLGLALFILAALVGMARVLGYIHSITDIIGSIVFVALAYVIASYAAKALLKKIQPSTEV
jgi:undecaprenyl-diphosphatase